MWTYREERQQFYLHQYLIQQPDLNYKNPKMKEYMFDSIKYWMDLGVDGFRFDAVTKLVEDERYLDEPQDPSTGYEQLKEDFKRTNLERTNSERANSERTNSERTNSERTITKRTNTERTNFQVSF